MPLPLFAARHHFDPRSIPGLEGWWDAADAASVTLDSGRVSEWRDKSGKGRHAANSTSGSTQPDYVTAGRNGLNVLRFAAASTQRLTIASSTAAFNFLHNGTASYVVAVSKYGTTANPNAVYALLGNNNGSSVNRGVFVMYDDRTATNGMSDGLLYNISAGTPPSTPVFVANPFNASNQALSAFNNLFTPQAFHVQEFLFDADNATLADRFIARIDGGSEKSGNIQSGTATTANATSSMQFGASGNNGSPLQGDICELLFFSQVPTALARDALRRYLAAKWGISVA